MHSTSAMFVAVIGLSLAAVLGACAVREAPMVNTASGNVSVGEPAASYVAMPPPEPLYEQMSPSPGEGAVWIDGSWHWNGHEWLWLAGRWEREQAGYVYVEPRYSYARDQFVYTPGYWALPDRVPRDWNVREHRDGRPTRVAPPPASFQPTPAPPAR